MSGVIPDGPGRVALARMAFPRGLCRVEGQLGLGMDGLLLAAFAGRHFAARGRREPFCVEIGSGNGGALLALALDLPALSGLGLEIQAQLVEAARENALRLGLEERVEFACLDLADIGPARHGAVMANPPYGLRGDGRPAKSVLRELAMRPAAGGLALFCRAAARLLRHHGHFFCVCKASRLPGLLGELDKNSLGARLALPVAPFAQSPASRVLLLARKGAAADLRIMPPLILHEGCRGGGHKRSWTAQAVFFCPRLACGRPAA